MTPQRKPGRPRSKDSTHYDAQGKEMVGFRYDASADTFVYRWKDRDGKWQKRNLSRDKEKAKRKYYRVRAQADGEPLTTVAKADYLEDLGARTKARLTTLVNEILEHKEMDPEKFVRKVMEFINAYQTEIHDSYVWKRVKQLIAQDPKTSANMLGIPYESLIGARKKKV